MGFEGEVYTLYVDPAFLGRGTGRALLCGRLRDLQGTALRSCLIWAHARNNACFFYEAMGGRRVATRTTRLMGELTPEIGFGWKRLVTPQTGPHDRNRNPATQSWSGCTVPQSQTISGGRLRGMRVRR